MAEEMKKITKLGRRRENKGIPFFFSIFSLDLTPPLLLSSLEITRGTTWCSEDWLWRFTENSRLWQSVAKSDYFFGWWLPPGVALTFNLAAVTLELALVPVYHRGHLQRLGCPRFWCDIHTCRKPCLKQKCQCWCQNEEKNQSMEDMWE